MVKSDAGKNNIGGAAEIFVIPDKRDQEKSESDERADDREVIQQKMQMSEVQIHKSLPRSSAIISRTYDRR